MHLPHIVVTFKIKDRPFIIVLLTGRTRLLYWFDTSRQKRVRLQEHAKTQRQYTFESRIQLTGYKFDACVLWNLVLVLCSSDI